MAAMSRSPDPERTVAPLDRDKTCVVVAGPGTSSTIPGIIVSEIVVALAASSRVRRIEVDLGNHPTMGLHRAPFLSAAHDVPLRFSPERHRAPRDTRARRKAFHQLIGPDVKLAIAYAWPGIDNNWIRDFLRVSKSIGVQTLVLCASLPPSREVRAISLVDEIRGADRVVVGDVGEVSELVAAFGASGPRVQAHRALSLLGRRRRTGPRQFTAFLPRDSIETFAALMMAFDAISDLQVNNYSLNVLTRYEGNDAKSIVAESHHAQHVQLISDDVTKNDLAQLCETSSAIGMANPQRDSRAFSTAVDCGIAAVVLASSNAALAVGRGYVGGLLAAGGRPASIHVAMAHAFRLDELGFPNPDAWCELADGLLDPRTMGLPAARASRHFATLSAERSPELTHFLQRPVETG
jgi:hypothetical protein